MLIFRALCLVGVASCHLSHSSNILSSNCLTVKFLSLPLVFPFSGYDFSLQVDMDSVSGDKAALARKVALLKRHCFASVFEHMFDKQAAGGSTEKAIIHYRDDETM